MQVKLIASNYQNGCNGKAKFSTTINDHQKVTNFYQDSDTRGNYCWLNCVYDTKYSAIKFGGYTSGASLPEHIIVNSIEFQIRTELTYSLGKTYFRLRTTNNRIIAESSYDSGSQAGTSHKKFYLSVAEDIAKELTREDLDNMYFEFETIGTIKNSGHIFSLYGSDITVDYTEVYETVLVPKAFTPSFKCQGTNQTPGTPGTMIADDLNIGGIYLSPDGYRDGQFYNFDYSNFSRYCPIRKAYIKFKVSIGTGVEDALYAIYAGNNRLAIFQPTVQENTIQTYTINLPNGLAYEWIKDLKFVMQGKSNRESTVALAFKGIELHILHDALQYKGKMATGHATNYIHLKYDLESETSGFQKLEDVSNFLSPVGTSGSCLTLLNGGQDYGNIDLTEFTFSGIPSDVVFEDVIIDRIDIRTQYRCTWAASLLNLRWMIMLDDTVLVTFNDIPAKTDVKYSKHFVGQGLRITSADLPRLRIRFNGKVDNNQNRPLWHHGLSIDLYAGDSLPETDEPTIVETAVKGDYSKGPNVLFPSENIKPNNNPEDTGYVGNLYNDDLNDYAEFTYTPTDAPAEPMPGERPYEAVIIASPTLSSLGIPSDANITRIILTEEGYVHTDSSGAEAELGLYINNNSYGKMPFENSTDFKKNVFDSGEISIPKLAIKGDTPTFQIRWYSLDADFTYRVRYLLWDITYEVGGLSFKLQLAQGNIDKIKVGSQDAMALYIGEGKII